MQATTSLGRRSQNSLRPSASTITSQTCGKDQALHLQGKLGGSEAGIVAVWHQQRPGMTSVAVECHGQGGWRSNGRHNANFQSLFLQKWALSSTRKQIQNGHSAMHISSHCKPAHTCSMCSSTNAPMSLLVRRAPWSMAS